jgi:hypothetical protein
MPAPLSLNLTTDQGYLLPESEIDARLALATEILQRAKTRQEARLQSEEGKTRTCPLEKAA